MIFKGLVWYQQKWQVLPFRLGYLTSLGDVTLTDPYQFVDTLNGDVGTNFMTFMPNSWTPGDYSATPPILPPYFTVEFFDGNPDFYLWIRFQDMQYLRADITDANSYPPPPNLYDYRFIGQICQIRTTNLQALPSWEFHLVVYPETNNIADVQMAWWAFRANRGIQGFKWGLTKIAYNQSDVQDLLRQMGIEGAEDEDPYEPGGESVEGGGGGTFSLDGLGAGEPGLPTLSAIDLGFLTIYRPSKAQMQALADFLWSPGFDLDQFKRRFGVPMDAIIGAQIVPVDPGSSGTKVITVGAISTGVAMDVAAAQYVSVDCGSLTIPQFFGSALDYSPYTKYSIYLPYVGTQTLKTDEVIGKTISVKYHIDILSGALTAFIIVDGEVFYEYGGNCAVLIPITSQSWAQAITSTIQLAASIGGTIASGGASAAGLVNTTANAVAAMKPEIQRSGSVSGSSGLLGNQSPFLIAELPRQSLAANYQKYVGFPSNITEMLGNLSGYTQVDECHLEGIPCTADELTEIETLLKGGVIL